MIRTLLHDTHFPGTGLIPHSPRWLAYWTSQMAKLFAGEELPWLIPLEAVGAILV